MSEYLLLKWGTLKGWKVDTEESREALKRYMDGGVALGAAQRHDSLKQKQALCDLIDAINGKIVNDWTGKTMTKNAAKKYVLRH